MAKYKWYKKKKSTLKVRTYHAGDYRQGTFIPHGEVDISPIFNQTYATPPADRTWERRIHGEWAPHTSDLYNQHMISTIEARLREDLEPFVDNSIINQTTRDNISSTIEDSFRDLMERGAITDFNLEVDGNRVNVDMTLTNSIERLQVNVALDNE